MKETKMKHIVIITCMSVVTLASYGYGVKGMRWGVRKSGTTYRRSGTTYRHSSQHTYSTPVDYSTKSGHGINGCGFKGCHGSLCQQGHANYDVKKQSNDMRDTLAAIRTANQTISTLNRIENSNERIKLARENLEVRKFNSGINSKFDSQTRAVKNFARYESILKSARSASTTNTIVHAEDPFYAERYREYCAKYAAEKDKKTNLARFYLTKMNEYGLKIGVPPVTAMQ